MLNALNVESIASNEGQLKLNLRSRVMDVVSLRVDLSQNANVVNSQTLDIGTQPLPEDPNHTVGMGGDALFLLASGHYGVTATALTADGNAVPSCTPAKHDRVRVKAGETTEIQLMVRCESVNPGLLDTTVVVETAPVLNEFTVTPNKFPCAGQDMSIAPVFTTPGGEEVAVTAKVLSGPADGNAKIDVQANNITFAGASPGDYMVQVTGQAPLGTATSQVVTIHVQGDGAACSSGGSNQPSDPNSSSGSQPSDPNSSGSSQPSDPNAPTEPAPPDAASSEPAPTEP